MHQPAIPDNGALPQTAPARAAAHPEAGSASPAPPVAIASALTAVIETPRLRLRYLRADDVAHLMPILSDPEVTRYLSYNTWVSIEDGQAWCDEFAETNRVGSTAWFVCFDKESGRMVGNCVLFDRQSVCGRAELGYMMGRAWWSRGFAVEAATAMIEHGFRRCNLQRVELQIHVENLASQRVAEKLGFQREGILRGRLVNCAGVPHDVVMYGLLRDDPPPAGKRTR